MRSLKDRASTIRAIGAELRNQKDAFAGLMTKMRCGGPMTVAMVLAAASSHGIQQRPEGLQSRNSTQTRIRTEGGWKIATAHVSLMGNTYRPAAPEARGLPFALCIVDSPGINQKALRALVLLESCLAYGKSHWSFCCAFSAADHPF
ncbi:hypothetical protein EDC90_105317 [Martelella mediterranea]|uniref:Uncharacterized protein n=1 Tax=Martelella mediterranea TaxID=293089 RepID=A0A4R3NKA6_9HYPH|nr:hypothetical protein EDC90_105317 [Martelella mediterranea]